MSDDRRPPELIELPLEHKKETWESVDKGLDKGSPPSSSARGRQPSRRWPWLVLVGALAAIGYWVFWPSPPRIEFEVESLAFADVLVGSSSEPTPVALRNVGERPLQVVAIGIAGEHPADFSTLSENCSGVLIEPGGDCAAEVAFSPRDMEQRLAGLEISGNMRGGKIVLPMSGRGIAPLLRSTPPVLDFGGESVGATSPALDLDLVNRGSAPLQIRSVALAGSDSEFSIVGNRCSKERLEPEQSCRIRVVFSPRLLGERAAELTVASDSHGEPEPIRLVGIGSGPDLEIEPAGIDFGTQLVGTSTEEQTLRLTNKGSEPFRVSSLSVKQRVGIEIVRQNCGRRVIAPGASCTATFRFSPRREGAVETSLQIREASGGLAPGVALAGTGVAPQLRTSVSELSFDGVVVGDTGASRRVEVRNPGTATLEVREVRLVGPNAGSFVKGRDSCSAVELPPGGRCTVDVQLRPRSGGNLVARLSFRSNVPGEAAPVALEGRGLVPELKLSRSRLDYVAVRQTESQDLRVQVENRGEAPLTVSSIRFEGTAAADFGLVTDGCSGRSLDAGKSCQLAVRFSPRANGLRDARLVIASDAPAGPASLILRGSGQPAPESAVETSPSEIDFGPRGVGQRSEVLTLVIRSTGQGRLELGRIGVAGEHAADFRLVAGTCDGLPYLVPGGDCSVGIRFVPGAAGRRSARLVVEHNAPGGELRLPLTGSGS